MNRLERRAAVRRVLLEQTAEAAAEAAAASGLVKGVNALFPCLYDLDEMVKWRAVTAIGLLVDRLAEEDKESARVVMRRLMWNLNDESGGIGWGSPEVFGEILARNKGLAAEYGHILLSYARQDGNYLELPQLQRGLMWGIGRFASAHPELMDCSAMDIRVYLSSGDTAVRGLAAWVAGITGLQSAVEDLRSLRDEPGVFLFFNGISIEERTVSEAAVNALHRLNSNGC